MQKYTKPLENPANLVYNYLYITCLYAQNCVKEETMKSISLLLNTTQSVKTFVNIISQYDFDMDLRCGRYVVDAKSILGIFSLDLNRPVVLEIHSDNDCDELIEKINKYICQ